MLQIQDVLDYIISGRKEGNEDICWEAGLERVSVEKCAANEGDLICADESWGV